jgi:SAM-dependent methyltransferase
MALRHLVDSILEHPAVYAAWQAPFVAQKFAPVERRLAALPVGRVLDVGCGPGTNAPRFGLAEYVGVDVNEDYLRIARSKYVRGQFVQADLSSADLTPFGTFDTILVNSFLHHLSDDAVARLLRQLQHLLTPEGRVHVLELVMPGRPSLARLMARLDRGRYARPLDAWRTMFSDHFEPVEFEPYHYGGGLWAMVYFQGRTRPCASR